MQVIAISSPDKFSSEVKSVGRMFELGLETFHVRKPKFSQRRMKQYLSMFPERHLDKVIIHSHHGLASVFDLKGVHLTRKHKKNFFTAWRLKWLKWFNRDLYVTSSFHSLRELGEFEYNYNYVFLSPIFESISKKGHNGSFPEDKLKKALADSRFRVFALGGAEGKHLEKVDELGFAGMALLGALWSDGRSADEVYAEVRALNSRGAAPSSNGTNLKISPIKLKIKKSA